MKAAFAQYGRGNQRGNLFFVPLKRGENGHNENATYVFRTNPKENMIAHELLKDVRKAVSIIEITRETDYNSLHGFSRFPTVS